MDQRAGKLAKKLSPEIKSSIESNQNVTITLDRSTWALAVPSLWEIIHSKYNTRYVDDILIPFVSDWRKFLPPLKNINLKLSFVFIKSMLNHPVNDHSMEGPTYAIALQREAEAFR